MANKEYFSHDYTTRSDEKIKSLIRKHGMIGYGIFWALVEDLYNNANALRLDYEGIAYDLRTESDIVKSVIHDFGLFEINDEIFYSISIQTRMDIRNSKSVKASKSANIRWDHANALRTQCEGNAIKEIKGKEIKEKKEIKVNQIKEKERRETEFGLSPDPHPQNSEGSNFENSDFENPDTSKKQKKQAGPGRKKQPSGLVSLEDWGDRARFDAEVPDDWPPEKRDHYWDALVNYSNKGHQYKDWMLTAKGWARRDAAQENPTPWIKKPTAHAKPKETPTQTDDITRIIDEFNALTQSQYDATDEAIRGYLAGRLMDGCRLQDMLDVIALKAVQWGSGDDRKYLKFHILFKPEKYPGYVQEVRDAKSGKIKVINHNESAYERIQRKIDAALGRTQTA